ncbi:MAG: outer rane receptor for ferrienterochelin and colicin [Ignavibacteria bacterium]|nr:outer rane receptor for ferrienterochelin and colicin [Ignavibacteria bacterium]
MKKSIFVIIATVLLCLILSNLELSAKEGSTIAGTVTDSVSGENIIGLTIAIYKEYKEGSKPVAGAYSNKYGFYSIPDVPVGEWFLIARGVGYSTYKRKIFVRSDSNQRIDIQLKQIDVRLQALTVEAEREPSPTRSISTIEVTPEFITKLPSLGGERDIFRALQLLPGVKSASELSSGLYIRGGSPDQNLNLLDGVIVYNPSHIMGFLSTFNSDAIRDIKLIKGAFPAEYGGRLSSVLDMTMKEGTKEKIKGSGGISLISTRLTVEGPLDENSTFMISGRRMYLDLITMLAAGGEEMPVYYFYDLNAKVNYKLSESDRIFLSGYFGKDVLEPPSGSKGDFNINWGNSTGNLRWMHIMSPELFMNFSLIYTKYDCNTNLGKSDSGAYFGTVSNIRDITFKGEAQYFPIKEHIIKTGVEATFHHFISKATNDALSEIIPSTEVSTLESAFYIQDEWSITPELATNLGMRFYYFQEGGYFNPEPRISASYAISDKLKIIGSIANANQYLHLIVRNDINLPTDLWFPSTAKVKPSNSWQGVLGFETTPFGKEYLFSIEGYYKKMKNLYEFRDGVLFATGIPLESQFTTGTGEAYGIEFFLNKRVGAITGWIAYTLAWTKRTFPELNNGKPFYPRYDRRHDVSIVFTYELSENWELGASWIYATGQAYTMPTGVYSLPDFSDNPDFINYNSRYQYSERNGERLPSFHKLDLNLMYKFEMFDLPFEFSINIYNVYNRKNPFMWFIENEYNPYDNTSKKVVKQFTLFPIIPTFGLNFTF